MSKGIIKKMKDGSEYNDSKRVELTEEQLSKIQGGSWDYVSNNVRSDQWDSCFSSGVYVVWRELGCIDHWCTVLGYEYVGDRITYFTLDCPSEGVVFYNIPASEVLMEYVD